MQKPKSKKGKSKIHKVMHEFKHGELHSGSKKGPQVRNRKQAIAIALSEAKKSAVLVFNLSKAKVEVPKEEVAHRDSMRRKVGMIRKIISHHGYKEYTDRGVDSMSHTKNSFSELHVHPDTGHSITFGTGRPSGKEPALQWHSYAPNNKVINHSSNRMRDWQYPLHELDSHLAEIHGSPTLAKKSIQLVFDLNKARSQEDHLKHIHTMRAVMADKSAHPGEKANASRISSEIMQRHGITEQHIKDYTAKRYAEDNPRPQRSTAQSQQARPAPVSRYRPPKIYEQSEFRQKRGIHGVLKHHGYELGDKENKYNDLKSGFQIYHHPEGHEVEVDHTGMKSIFKHRPAMRWTLQPKNHLYDSSKGFKVSHPNWDGANRAELGNAEKANTIHKLDAHLSKIHGTTPKYGRSMRFYNKSQILVFDLNKAGSGYSPPTRMIIDTSPKQRDVRIKQAEAIRELVTSPEHGFVPHKATKEEGSTRSMEYDPHKYIYSSTHRYTNPDTNHKITVHIPHGSGPKGKILEWTHTANGRNKRGSTLSTLAAHLGGRLTHGGHQTPANKSFNDFSDKGKLSPDAKKRIRTRDRQIKVAEGYRKTTESAGYEPIKHPMFEKDSVQSTEYARGDGENIHQLGIYPPTKPAMEGRRNGTAWNHSVMESNEGTAMTPGRGHGNLVRHLKKVHPNKSNTIKSVKPLCSLCKGKHLVRVVFKSDGYEEEALRACPICHNIKEI